MTRAPCYSCKREAQRGEGGSLRLHGHRVSERGFEPSSACVASLESRVNCAVACRPWLQDSLPRQPSRERKGALLFLLPGAPWLPPSPAGVAGKFDAFPSFIFSPNGALTAPVDAGSWSGGGPTSTGGTRLCGQSKVRAEVTSAPPPPPRGPQAPLQLRRNLMSHRAVPI